LKFLNEDTIITNGKGVYDGLRRDALTILGSALDAVEPAQAVHSKIKLRGQSIRVEDKTYDLSQIERIYLVGGGKAGGAMAEAAESILGDKLTGGVVNVLKGTEGKHCLKKVKLIGASHPVPDEAGVRGVKEMLDMVSELTRNDLVIVIISGGGSALMPCPANSITLADLQTVTAKLLKKGATINDLNTVRKHLDSFKGGQLAKRCQPAEVLSLILSDVVGDPLDTIASGPTVPDSKTWVDAEAVLKKYDVWGETPPAIKERIKAGVTGSIPDTPKENDPVFKRTKNILVASNSYAAQAAFMRARQLKYNSMVLSTMVEGEARYVGSVYAGIARELATRKRPLDTPAAIIIGGETTVEVKGAGKGGRNQEVALGGAKLISGLPCLIASLATDGFDGPTDSAGAIVDGATFEKANRSNLSIDATLKENDAYHFFDRLGDLLITGPTGTNVNDLALILVSGD
jgi:glycerate 2-kinase